MPADFNNETGFRSRSPRNPEPSKRNPVFPVILAAVVLILAALFFISTRCHHTWQDATCTEAKTCSQCGATRGSALGHNLTDATCTEPARCRDCGFIQSPPTGHAFSNATCTAPSSCSQCGLIQGEALGHQWPEGNVSSTRTCARCSFTEEYSLADRILDEADHYVRDGQHRLAIQLLDAAWKEHGLQIFRDRAAQCRTALGNYMGTVLAAGKYNSALLDAQGSLQVVGDNKYSELQGNYWSDLVAVSLGDRHILGLRSDGTVIAAGANDVEQCEFTGWNNAIAISAGDTHSVALLEDGTVVACGFQYPDVCDTDALMAAAGGRRIISISAGYRHTLALLEDGTVVASETRGHSAGNVSDWSDIAAIVTGTDFSAGLRSDGTVVVTQKNWSVSWWSDIVALAAGDFFLMGLRSDGTVLVVGDEGTPDVSRWSDVILMAAGNDHAIAIDLSGNLLTAGSNRHGQLNLNQ